MKLSIAKLLILLAAAATLVAQDKPDTLTTDSKANGPHFAKTEFSELQSARILIAYHKAIELQANKQMAEKAFEDAKANFAAVVAHETETAGMAKGTQVNVDAQTDKVTPVPPTPAKEPAAKK